MKILVLGSGGREHALAWKLSGSPRCEAVYLHPGNAGTRRAGIPHLEGAAPDDPLSITRAAKERGVSLVVIGPEVLLAAGMADHLRKEGLLVVGPGRDSARLETSKVFAKQFMKAAEIPTAPFWVAASRGELEERAARGPWPQVLKLDGLAAGKGVVVAREAGEIERFSRRIWRDGEFGEGPHRVVVESFIGGSELSYMGLCDGVRFLPLASATDYKRVGDGDRGPNTGGMGAISPSPVLTRELEAKIHERILQRTLKELSREGLFYRGVLYVGLMVTDTGDPFVLEFNARFGDPETQAVLLRLESDLVTLLEHVARGTLVDCPAPQWSSKTAIYVVGAAEGYPEKVRTGDPISGLDDVPPETAVFFSGVREENGRLLTGGGRVLGVGATADDAEQARALAYSSLSAIRWRGKHARSDIGFRLP